MWGLQAVLVQELVLMWRAEAALLVRVLAPVPEQVQELALVLARVRVQVQALVPEQVQVRAGGLIHTSAAQYLPG